MEVEAKKLESYSGEGGDTLVKASIIKQRFLSP